MTTSTAEFEQLESALQSGGVETMLDSLTEQLRGQKKYHELFEALKMKVRQRLDLPLLYGDEGDELDARLRDQLEEGLIEACREVGLLLIREGSLREGYMYLRPVGDKEAVVAELAKIEPDEDNLEEYIELALHEGLDVRRGFQLVLEHYGTCNSITTYEQSMPQRAKSDQQTAAALLLEHLHKELVETVKADIAQQEGGAEPAESTLGELVADRDWLFNEGSYHVDTTHLGSTVRFARVLEDAKLLRLALDLTHYGRLLDTQFQYQGDEPFADFYPSHALYYQALLGENVDESLAYFKQKSEMLDVDSHGMAAIEIYIDLLARLDRYQEAIDATIDLTPADAQPIGFAPSLLDLSQSAGQYDSLLEHSRGQGNLLSFAAGLAFAKGSGK